jgi:hypothetical protein
LQIIVILVSKELQMSGILENIIMKNYVSKQQVLMVTNVFYVGKSSQRLYYTKRRT